MNFWVLIYRAAWGALGLLVIVILIAAFRPPVRQYRELRHREAVLQEDIRLEEQMLKQLKEQQERLQSDPRFVERIAREELGFAKPGETIVKFTDDGPMSNRPAR